MIAMSFSYAYLLGCLWGDAWVYHTGPPKSLHAVGMNAKDREFVRAFADALAGVVGKHSPVRQFDYVYGPQWRTIAYSSSFVHEVEEIGIGDLDTLLGDFYPRFLQGMYDSDGSLYIRRRGPTSVQPVYRIWNADRVVLSLCQDFLMRMAIHGRLFLSKKKGEKTVGETIRKHDLHCLCWQGHSSSRIWELRVGSSIQRKRYDGPGPSSIHCPRKYKA